MNRNKMITRRQALSSLATISTGILLKPTGVFGLEPVKNQVRFAVIGDWGTGKDESQVVARQMLAAHRQTPLDFIITAGDNIYPNGSGRHFVKHFEDPFADLLRKHVKFYAVLGNHDVWEGRQDQCQYPLFNMGGRNYYTLKQGNGLVEFFMLDSTDFDDPQAKWLEQELCATTAKWKVVVFHHPIYSSGKTHGSNHRLRKKLEPILTRFGVNMVFSGHDHIYERIKQQQGIQYFVTGAGGKVRHGNVDLHSEIRSSSFDKDNHFMMIEIQDRQISFQAVSRTGEVFDRGAVVQR